EKLLRLDAHAEDPVIWEELLSHILHPGPLKVAAAEGVPAPDLRQSTLWKWGISGDVPFILVEGDLAAPSPLLSELLRAQRWWRARGEKVDIVVLDRGPEG